MAEQRQVICRVAQVHVISDGNNCGCFIKREIMKWFGSALALDCATCKRRPSTCSVSMELVAGNIAAVGQRYLLDCKQNILFMFVGIFVEDGIDFSRYRKFCIVVIAQDNNVCIGRIISNDRVITFYRADRHIVNCPEFIEVEGPFNIAGFFPGEGIGSRCANKYPVLLRRINKTGSVDTVSADVFCF